MLLMPSQKCTRRIDITEDLQFFGAWSSFIINLAIWDFPIQCKCRWHLGSSGECFSEKGDVPANVRLEGGGENKYLWLPGLILMGRGDGGVGGHDDGETFPSFNFSSYSSIKIKFRKMKKKNKMPIFFFFLF